MILGYAILLFFGVLKCLLKPWDLKRVSNLASIILWALLAQRKLARLVLFRTRTSGNSVYMFRLAVKRRHHPAATRVSMVYLLTLHLHMTVALSA